MLVKTFSMTRLDFGQGVGKGDSYRQSAMIRTCDTPDSDRTLIIHANVYDQDQGLTGRYHSTTLQIKKISYTSIILQARGLKGSNTRARS